MKKLILFTAITLISIQLQAQVTIYTKSQIDSLFNTVYSMLISQSNLLRLHSDTLWAHNERINSIQTDVEPVPDNSKEQLILKSTFDDVTIQQSTNKDSINYFYLKGINKGVLSRLYIMNGKDTLNPHNAPQIVTDPLNPKNKVLMLTSDGANEYVKSRPTQPSTWATRTQVDVVTNNAKGLDSLYEEVRIMIPNDWQILKDLHETITWMTVGEYWNEAQYPNMMRITITLGKYSSILHTLNFRITGETRSSSTANFVKQFSYDSNFDFPLDKWVTIRLNIIEADAEAGKIFMSATTGAVTDTLFNLTNIYTKHPNQVKDGIEYFAPMKLYTFSKYADMLKEQNKTLKVYFDDILLINGRSLFPKD